MLKVVDIAENILADLSGREIGAEGRLNTCADCASGQSQYKVTETRPDGKMVSYYLCAEHLAARGLTVTDAAE